MLNTICKTSPDPIKDKQKPFQAPKANASAFKGDDSGGGEARPRNITHLINERPTIWNTSLYVFIYFLEEVIHFLEKKQ